MTDEKELVMRGRGAGASGEVGVDWSSSLQIFISTCGNTGPDPGDLSGHEILLFSAAL